MKRFVAVDVLKTVAVIFVIAVHYLLNGGFYDATIDSPIRVFWLGMRQLFITCVPLFLVATGFLMNKKELSRDYVRKLFSIMGLYCLLSLFDWGVSRIVMGETTTFVDALRGLFDFSTDSYAWYVEMYIGLYLIIPLLNQVWWAKDEGKYHRYILLVSAVLFFLPSSLNVYGKVLPDFWQAAYPIGYYFLGAACATYPKKVAEVSCRKSGLLIAVFVIFFTFIDWYHNQGQVFHWADYNDYYGLEVALMTSLMTLFLLNLKVPQFLNRYLFIVSQSTLSIYLISDVTDKLYYPIVRSYFPALDTRLYYGGVIILGAVIAAGTLGCCFYFLYVAGWNVFTRGGQRR